jgi:hypothetical protein
MNDRPKPRPPETYGSFADKALPYGGTWQEYLELAMAALDQAGISTIDLDVLATTLPVDAEAYVRSLGWFSKDIGARR